jgi:hypothetical protein
MHIRKVSDSCKDIMASPAQPEQIAQPAVPSEISLSSLGSGQGAGAPRLFLLIYLLCLSLLQAAGAGLQAAAEGSQRQPCAKSHKLQCNECMSEFRGGGLLLRSKSHRLDYRSATEKVLASCHTIWRALGLQC